MATFQVKSSKGVTVRIITQKKSVFRITATHRGAPGQDGTNGTNGQGVPTGGAVGQVLAKNSSGNYDTSFVSVMSLVDLSGVIPLVPSPTVGNVPTITSGGALANSGKAAPSGGFVGTTDAQTLSNKNLVQPLLTTDATLNGLVATNRSFFIKTANVTRWELVGSNGAEAGSDAGTDFAINAYTDAGAYKATPIYLHRDTGGIDLNGAVAISGTLTLNGVSVPTPSSTTTFTNKRITQRINSTASSATPAINVDTTDQFEITALAANITNMSTNLTGTPTDGQRLMIRIKDNGTSRTITWGASFVSSGVALLLAATAINKTHLVYFIYDSIAAKWICSAVDATGY